MRITKLLLQPAAPHSGQHHAQRHEAGADGVMRRLMLAARDVNHVEKKRGGTEAVAELFDGDARANCKQISRLRIREPDENRVRQVNRQQHRPEPGFQPASRRDKSSEQRAENECDETDCAVNYRNML